MHTERSQSSAGRQPNNLPRDQDNTRSPTRSAAAHILPSPEAAPRREARADPTKSGEAQQHRGTRSEQPHDDKRPARRGDSPRPRDKIRTAAPEAPAKIRASAEAARPATRSGGSRGEYLSASQEPRTRSGRAEPPAAEAPQEQRREICQRQPPRRTCRKISAGNLPREIPKPFIIRTTAYKYYDIIQTVSKSAICPIYRA